MLNPLSNKFIYSLECVILFLLISSQSLGQCTVNAGADVVICQGESVVLGGSPTVSGNSGGVTYTWDNGAAAVANPTVSPTTTTTYTVSVSGGGCQANASDEVVVQVKPKPNASFTFGPNQACAGTPVNFISTVSACAGCSYAWDFGDPSSGAANTSSIANPTHVFDPIGNSNSTYTVTLVVTSSNGCQTVVTQTVTVKQRPNAVLTEDMNFTQCLGLSSFYAYVSNASTPATNSNYSIHWGDGSAVYSSNTPPVSLEHIYSGVDIWTLDYIVTGSNGCIDTTHYLVTNISNPAIGAATNGNTIQCGPVDICFELTSYMNNFSEIMYDVDFGDGSPVETYSQSNLPNPVCHQYSTSSCPGAYTFSITAVSNCPTPTVAQITPIQIFSAPQAAFTSPANACVNTAVPFTNTSIPGYNQGCNSTTTYQWNFGDPSSGANNTSTAMSPSHTYSTPGTYTVTLTATNGGNPQLACGTTTYVQSICVESPPLPSVGVNQITGCVPLTINTTNASTTLNTCNVASTWVIDYSELPCQPNGGAYQFLSGTNANSTQPTLLLQSEGVYTLRYQMQNSCGMQEDVETITVNAAPVVDVTTPSAGVCAGTSGTPSATVNTCGLASSYTWTFAGGTPSSASTLNPPAINYASAGNYNVTLEVTNACGTTTDVATMQVLNIPDVQITAFNNDLSICYGQPTTLTATGAASYTWSPSTNLSNYSPSGNTVTASPTGAITYTVTGTSGSCTDTGSITLSVVPLPTITATGTFSLCIGETEPLGVNASGGSGVYNNYTWNPASGLSNASIANPLFQGSNSTTYTVTVTDSEGCVGSGQVPVIVNPLPVVTAGSDVVLCNQPIATPLTGFSPTTGGVGTWSGNHVTAAGVYTPMAIGFDTLTYCFQNSTTGCSACDEMVVEVTNPTLANGGPDSTFCMNSGSYQLPVGQWSGSTWVSPGGLFTPSEAGVFTLTVLQGTGSCQSSDQVELTVLPLPEAYAGSDTTLCVGESAMLHSLCTNCPNGPLDVCSWSGAALSNPLSCSPIATPTITTTYTLSVIDQAGCTDTDQVTVFVNPLPPTNAGADLVVCNQPIATQLVATPAGGVWSGTDVSTTGEFIPTSTGTVTLTYCYTNGISNCSACDVMNVEVNDPVIAVAGVDVVLCANEGVYVLQGFSPTVGGSWSGDGVIDAAGVVQTELMTAGDHVLTLSTGSGTCLTTDQMVLTILETPVVQAGPGAVICGNAAIFNLTGNLPVSGGTWEGPGITNSTVGTFDPSLGTSSNEVFYWFEDASTGCRDTAYTSVVINAPPTAGFNLNPQGCTNGFVDYSNTSIGGDVYTWDFGDGTVENGFLPDYMYDSEGVFQITQVVENVAGCKDTAYHTHEIISPPIAGMNLTTVEGCAPLTVPFDNESIGQYVTYAWDLSITTSNDSLPSPVTYPQGEGIVVYPISLSVTNYCGTDIAIDSITVLPQPQASFGTNLNGFCSPFTVLFNNTSVGLPEVYEWDFGDGTSSSLIQPLSHTYYTGEDSTDYTIGLYLTNACGVDTAYHTITVWPNTITGFFNTSVIEGCEPLLVQFTDFSSGATQVSYYLGDGYGITSDDNPSQLYSAGVHTIYQYADNGCSYDTTSVTITVYDAPDLDFTSNVNLPCPHELVSFNSQTDDAIEMFWDFGDGHTSGLEHPNHAYEFGGNYTVTLTGVNDEECSTTVQHAVFISNGPQADFTVPSQVGCSPWEVCFVNSSINGNFYTWNFGDGNSGNGASSCHTYQNISNDAASVTVQLIAQDMQLCRDTAEVNLVVAPQPLSAFSLPDFNACLLPQIVIPLNQSQYANGYQWMVNNEVVSNQSGAQIVMSQSGSYDITLLANNEYGCESTVTQHVEIPLLPEAMISANPRQGCVPLTISFINESDNAVDYLWDLGNGLVSNDVNPNFTYQIPGNYDVTLIAFNAEGCADTLYAEDYIRVFNLPVADFWMDPEEATIYQSTIHFHNTSYNAYQARWYFGDGSESTSYDVEYTYPDAGLWPVTLAVWNMYGCKAEKHDVVIVHDVFNVFVPNAFTPDDDGINEVFLPQISGKPFIHRYLLRIFDRWGTLIFETDDFEEAWTGNVRGGTYYAKDEVYNWQIQIQLKGSDEQRTYQGHVSLLR